MTDWRDLVIDELADSEAALRARVADLEQDVFWYRAIGTEAIHALHKLTRERDHLRDQLREQRLEAA